MPHMAEGTGGSNTFFLTEFVEGIPLAQWMLDVTDIAQSERTLNMLYRGVIVDVLLGNVEVLGENGMNIIVDRHGKPYRTSFASCFGYNVLGERRATPYDGEIDDLHILRTQESSAMMFGILSNQVLRDHALQIQPFFADMASLVPTIYRTAFDERLRKLKELLEIAPTSSILTT